MWTPLGSVSVFSEPSRHRPAPMAACLTLLFVAVLTMCGCAAVSPVAPTPGPWRFSGTIFGVEGQRVAGRPIADAKLTIVGGVHSNMVITTDAGGHYAFPSMETSRFHLIISAPGFVPVTPEVALSRDLKVDFALIPR